MVRIAYTPRLGRAFLQQHQGDREPLDNVLDMITRRYPVRCEPKPQGYFDIVFEDEEQALLFILRYG